MQAPPANIEFGALERTRTYYGDGTFPRHEDVFAPIPRNLWQPVSLNRHVTTIYSQLSTMCTANGACGAMMAERSFRGRPHNPVLSPEHLFGQVASWGEGSGLDEILQAMVKTGVCSRELIPQDNWRPSEWPPGWEAEAGQNKMREWIDLDARFDAVATALQRFRLCLVGVYWPGTRRKGHGVCVTELWRAGENWGIGGPNSWSLNWGRSPDYTPQDILWIRAHGRIPFSSGFYSLTERECADFGSFGCWAAGAST